MSTLRYRLWLVLFVLLVLVVLTLGFYPAEQEPGSAKKRALSASVAAETGPRVEASSSIEPAVDQYDYQTPAVLTSGQAVQSDNAQLSQLQATTDQVTAEQQASSVVIDGGELAIAEPEGSLAELHLLQTAFDDEAQDPEWAPLFEDEVWRDFANAEIANSYLNSVDCRTSMCRIEISHDDEQAESEFLAQLPEMSEGQSGSIHRLNSEQAITTLLYIDR